MEWLEFDRWSSEVRGWVNSRVERGRKTLKDVKSSADELAAHLRRYLSQNPADRPTIQETLSVLRRWETTNVSALGGGKKKPAGKRKASSKKAPARKSAAKKKR